MLPFISAATSRVTRPSGDLFLRMHFIKVFQKVSTSPDVSPRSRKRRRPTEDHAVGLNRDNFNTITRVQTIAELPSRRLENRKLKVNLKIFRPKQWIFCVFEPFGELKLTLQSISDLF